VSPTLTSTGAYRGWALAVVAVGLAGCSGGSPGSRDAGSPRDATIVDSTIVPSDATVDAHGSLDGGPVNDAGPSACGGACDPRVHDACGAAMACRLGPGGPSCVPTATTADAGPPAIEGGACTSGADCESGLACYATGTGTGTCGRPCCGTRMDCASSERCRGDGMLVDGTVTAWGECLPPLYCDLMHPMATCAAREGCYIVDEVGTTECLSAGSAVAGAACAGASDCVPGNVCAGLTIRTCVPICFLGSTEPHMGCATTEHCEAQAYSPAGTGICVPT
jgi:hypothetical protein